MSATPVTAPPARFNFARHLIELNAGRAGRSEEHTSELQSQR